MGLDIHQIPSIHTPPAHAPTASRQSSRNSPPSEERPSLPSIGLSISRPSSRLSTTSSRSISSGYYESAARHNVQLPGLSTLANIASSTPPPEMALRQLSHPSQPGQINMFNFTPAPPATPSGVGAAPPACQNCSTSTTPLWRRDENGCVLCNACGLFLKLHGRPRPISLKTDVIKSRNRVKATGRNGKRLGEGSPNGAQVQQMSLAASHPGLSSLNPEQRLQQPIPQSASTDRSNSPLSRSGTPGLGGHNIAPQHLFDQVVQIPGATGSESYGPSPPIAQFSFRPHSPGAASTLSLAANGALNSAHHGTSNGHLEASQDVKEMRTRVSELEVINDLFKGRVAELESMEQQARQQAELERQDKERLMVELEVAKRRIEELEAENGPRSKRLRIDDFVQDDPSGSES